MSASSLRRRPFLDVDRPVLFAHRGGAKLWPENTLVAFRGALDLGMTFLETDVHETKDGVLVVHHDERVDRTTDGSGRIRDLTYTALERFDAGYRFTKDGASFPYRGKGLRIPTLVEAFALSDRARFNVEIKPRGRRVVRKLWEFIDTHGFHDRVLVAAGDDVQVRRFRKLSKNRVATSASTREALRFWLSVHLHIDRFVPVAFDALQVPTTYLGLTVVDREFIRAAHHRGVQVHVWTIDEPSEIRRLLNIGVDGIMSDRPDRLVALPLVQAPDTLRPLPG
ncbi:MAG TPA: glycerophosphodiester phosphodiesterase [Polyangiaceae bacterium]|jgi:glycerophosphoryl diester phosphodiesterase|nr:glycerophosphodiester phosphodiesterase [Polyangiaceae bacterium]